MKLRRAHGFALACCTAWAVFGWAYLGVEDGSSGLSPLGWLHALFFLPALGVAQGIWGSHSNADLLWMGLVAWLFWSLSVLAVVQMVGTRRRMAVPGTQP